LAAGDARAAAISGKGELNDLAEPIFKLHRKSIKVFQLEHFFRGKTMKLLLEPIAHFSGMSGLFSRHAGSS
jgi:hypothetical protein